VAGDRQTHRCTIDGIEVPERELVSRVVTLVLIGARYVASEHATVYPTEWVLVKIGAAGECCDSAV